MKNIKDYLLYLKYYCLPLRHPPLLPSIKTPVAVFDILNSFILLFRLVIIGCIDIELILIPLFASMALIHILSAHLEDHSWNCQKMKRIFIAAQ